MKLTLVSVRACVAALAALSSVLIAGAEQTASRTVQKTAKVHAASVDLPRVATLSHASPETWHTLPPVPNSERADARTAALLVWLSHLAVQELQEPDEGRQLR